MMKKNLSLFFVFLTAIMAVMTLVSAANIGDINADVRGQTLYSGWTDFSVSRGETLPVHITFTAVADVEDVQVSAEIKGYRKAINDETARFDVLAGRTYDKYLYLTVPADIGNGDYTLNVEITSKNMKDTATFDLTVQRNSYTLEVLSIDTQSVIAAGKILTANVVVKNRGSHDAEDVYVKASVPELGVEKNVYVGDLLSADTNYRDDAKEKQISLVIPSNAKRGTYQLVVEAYNTESSVSKLKAFNVEGAGTDLSTAIIPKEVSKEVEQGKTSTFEITLVNLAETEQSYSIDVTGVDSWAVAQVSPSIDVNLATESSQTVTVYLTPSVAAALGKHSFSVDVKSGNAVVGKVDFVADVVKEKALNALTLSAIILAVVLAALIIALIMLKAQGGKESRTEEEISYY